MPLFDYRCQSCHRTFEQLVRGRDRVACPGCGALTVRKLLSVPAPSPSASAVSAPCGEAGPPGGCCGGGACGLN